MVADFPSWSELSLAAGDRRAASGRRAPVSGRFSRVRIDPARGAATHIGDQPSEFPRIDDRLTGRRHRYLTVGWRSRCRRGKRACTGGARAVAMSPPITGMAVSSALLRSCPIIGRDSSMPVTGTPR